MLNFIKNLFFPTQVGVSTVSDSSIFMLKLKESLVELRTNAEDNEASFIFYKNGVTAVINIFIRKLHSLNGVDVTDAMTAAANQDLAGKLKNFNSSRETYLEKIISIINELETTTAVEPNIVVGFPYVAAAIISIGVCFTVLAVIGGVFLIKNYYNPVIVKTDIQAKIEGLKNQIKIISEAKDSKITLLQEKKNEEDIGADITRDLFSDPELISSEAITILKTLSIKGVQISKEIFEISAQISLDEQQISALSCQLVAILC